MPAARKKPAISYTDIGQRLRALRQERDWSQARLARILGTHQTNVSEMERGVRGMSVKQLVKLARALDVSPNDLIGEGNGGAGGRAKLPPRFVRRLERVGTLPKAEQDALLTIIDKMLGAAPGSPRD
jgi:transcriptional regulator with XRE-family HTH domain